MFDFLRQTKRIPDNPDRNYHAYTTEFDRVISSDELDAFLGIDGEAAWRAITKHYDDAKDALLAAGRMSAIGKISDFLARQDGETSRRTCAALLIDHSGSLRGQKAMIACLTTELIAEIWSRLGIHYEVLGFTTSSWRGGQSRKKWLRDGKPRNPGRLCDLLHIVYHNAYGPHAGWLFNFNYLLRRELLKENVDGEAILWAAGRLRTIEADRRILLVLSDGAPVDDSTLAANTLEYLSDHLASTVKMISNEAGFHIAGIGIDYDISRYYQRFMKLNSTKQFKDELVDFVISSIEK